MKKRRVHFVMSTHWDREWYQTFQDYRFRLVRVLDHVVDGLLDGRMKGPFTCDGQVIMLEDYLEVRPERRTDVERLVTEGKLAVGPWYVMPDEFLVSGESLIRNIELGYAVSRAMGGEPSKAGLVCDIFGHNSQFPQLCAGFGMLGALIWRGINVVDTRNLIWEGADGTRLPTYRFGANGYSSYADMVRHAFEPRYRPDASQTREDLDEFLQIQADQSPVSPILLFDGSDHQGWDEAVYDVLLRRMAEQDDAFEFVHSSLDAYLQDVLSEVEQIDLTASGELREPARYRRAGYDTQSVPAGVASSRVWMKQDNNDCETTICHWAEPMSSYAHLALGERYPQGYLDVAWRWLIKNHPHDSICGCSIDAVHEDMRFRFHQCKGIAERLKINATMSLAASVAGSVDDGELRVVLFNPLPRDLDEAVDVVLRIPSDWPRAGRPAGPAFRIFDGDTELPYQRLGEDLSRSNIRTRYDRWLTLYKTDNVGVTVELSLPAMGFRTLTVRPAADGARQPHPMVPGLATSERSMANECLDVTINDNGSLDVTDKRTGEIYKRLLTFEDNADVGDGWNHRVAMNNRVYASTASASAVSLVSDGPLHATFGVRTMMNVPEAFDYDRQARSKVMRELVIESLITLHKGLDRLEIETFVDNTVFDHRLRVLFPSGSKTATYWADSAFDVVERPIALRTDNHLYREMEIETKPQRSWTAVAGGGRGLAVVAEGLLETAVRDTAERPVALTLFRGTRSTTRTDGEPGGQLLGPLAFRYWIRPLVGRPDLTEMCYLGQQISAGICAAQLESEDIDLYRCVGDVLDPVSSFLSVTGKAVLTSCRMRGDHLALRLFNPTACTQTVAIRVGETLGARISTAHPVDLDGDAAGESLPITDGALRASFGAKQIRTFQFG